MSVKKVEKQSVPTYTISGLSQDQYDLIVALLGEVEVDDVNFGLWDQLHEYVAKDLELFFQQDEDDDSSPQFDMDKGMIVRNS